MDNNLTPKEKLKIKKQEKAQQYLDALKRSSNLKIRFNRKKEQYKKDTMNNINYVIGPDSYNRQKAWHEAGQQFNNMSTHKKVILYAIIFFLTIFIIVGLLTFLGVIGSPSML